MWSRPVWCRLWGEMSVCARGFMSPHHWRVSVSTRLERKTLWQRYKPAAREWWCSCNTWWGSWPVFLINKRLYFQTFFKTFFRVMFSIFHTITDEKMRPPQQPSFPTLSTNYRICKILRFQNPPYILDRRERWGIFFTACILSRDRDSVSHVCHL